MNLEIGQAFYLLQNQHGDFIYSETAICSFAYQALSFNDADDAKNWARRHNRGNFKPVKYLLKDIVLEPAPQETTEKSEPIILLRVGDKWSDDWIKRVYIDDNGDWRFGVCKHALDAKAFNDLHEVNAFLGDLLLSGVFIFVSRHDPKTRHIIGEGYIKTI